MARSIAVQLSAACLEHAARYVSVLAEKRRLQDQMQVFTQVEGIVSERRYQR